MTVRAVQRRSARNIEIKPARWAGVLRGASGTLLLGALVFAPWCWGCAWPRGAAGLDLILLGAAVCRLPLAGTERIPGLLMSAVAVILAQGWFMGWNGHSLFVEEARFFAPVEAAWPKLPGSVDRISSLREMAHVTAMMGAMLVACCAGQRRAWREGIVAVTVIVAVSIVLLGCAERWTGATDIFWSGARRLDYFFASYRNVTNAGEYLNAVLPLAGVAAWIAWGRGALVRAGSLCALAMVAVGCCVCGSKAAPMVGILIGIGFVIFWRRRMPGRMRWGGTAALLVCAVTLAAMAWGAGLGVSTDRWLRFVHSSDAATLVDRWRVDEVCVRGLPGAGILGRGPGTFGAVFARMQDGMADPVPGRWLAAHDDYVQTMLEWGASGALAWSVCFFGAILVLARGLQRGRWRGEDRVMACGLVLALAGVALMALVDFPLQVASLRVLVAVLMGLAWSSRQWPRARREAADLGVAPEPAGSWKNVLRGGWRFLPSTLTRCVDRRCCEFYLSGSVDPIPETTASHPRRK